MSSFRQRLRQFIRLVDETSRRADPLNFHAQSRAIQLLKRHLTPEQRAQYEKHCYFYVSGGNSGRIYRIRHGAQLNVEQLDKRGKRIGVLCFMPEGGLAVGDIMLAQKVALELFETEALQIANTMPTLETFLG